MTHPAARRAIAANVRKALLVVAIGRAERHFLDRLVNDETLKRHKETKKTMLTTKIYRKRRRVGAVTCSLHWTLRWRRGHPRQGVAIAGKHAIQK